MLVPFKNCAHIILRTLLSNSYRLMFQMSFPCKWIMDCVSVLVNGASSMNFSWEGFPTRQFPLTFLVPYKCDDECICVSDLFLLVMMLRRIPVIRVSHI